MTTRFIMPHRQGAGATLSTLVRFGIRESRAHRVTQGGQTHEERVTLRRWSDNGSTAQTARFDPTAARTEPIAHSTVVSFTNKVWPCSERWPNSAVPRW